MKEIIKNILKTTNKNSAPTEQLYFELQEKIDFEIDNDYLEFIKEHNGAEGFLNENSFIQLWAIEDILALNPYYEDVKECENLFFFGSNGSNTGFAFNKIDGIIVSINFLDILDREPDFISKTFESFLVVMQSIQ